MAHFYPNSLCRIVLLLVDTDQEFTNACQSSPPQVHKISHIYMRTCTYSWDQGFVNAPIQWLCPTPWRENSMISYPTYIIVFPKGYT